MVSPLNLAKVMHNSRFLITLFVLLLITVFGITAQTKKTKEPDWVKSPNAEYKEGRYITAVGHGSDRSSAEQRALTALAGRFGQSVQQEIKTLSSYSEAVRNGTVDISENTAISDAISISTKMDSLIGAEIADVWYDGKSIHYALAVMEKASASLLYSQMLKTNLQIIDNLVTFPEKEKNSLEAYSNYQLAAVIADANQLFYNVLSVVGSSAGISPGKNGDSYRIAAAEIVKNIPIAINVTNDKENRIKTAFSEAINKAGFRSASSNTRYVLNAVLNLTSTENPNQKNQFSSYSVEARLIDTQQGGVVLFPFNISGREGHVTIQDAENRAINMAVREINEKYGEAFLAGIGGKKGK